MWNLSAALQEHLEPLITKVDNLIKLQDDRYEELQKVIPISCLQ